MNQNEQAARTHADRAAYVEWMEDNWRAEAARISDAFPGGLVDRLLASLEAAEQENARHYELAQRAAAIASAPDYDEQAIKEALWALVDAVLAARPARTGEGT